jgi:hypothetical protein
VARPFDHDDLGIDLEWAKSLPECQACRKRTDGAKRCPDGTNLCGTHFDEWIARRWRADEKGVRSDRNLTAADFARELREGKFRPCWEAKIEE